MCKKLVSTPSFPFTHQWMLNLICSDMFKTPAVLMLTSPLPTGWTAAGPICWASGPGSAGVIIRLKEM